MELEVVSRGPTIAAIKALRDALGEGIFRTPVMRLVALERLLGNDTRIFGKLEFLQQTGTFKARGALAVLNSLSAEQLAAGVTGVSAGNHAVATAYAAQAAGASAKIVMVSTANPVRVEACRSYGAELVMVENVHEAFIVAERIQEDEGRFFVHPFEGPLVATGTGMVGLEICEQIDHFDAVVVPIGGGGLIGGISNAIKSMRPDCEVVGVEPEGADSMHRSFAANEPRPIDEVGTIADSLGAPFALPYSFDLCKRNVDSFDESRATSKDGYQARTNWAITHIGSCYRWLVHRHQRIKDRSVSDRGTARPVNRSHRPR